MRSDPCLLANEFPRHVHHGSLSLYRGDILRLHWGYIEVVEEYLTEVRRGCARKGIDYQMISTKDYLDAALSKFLHHREAMAKAPAKSQAPG